MSGKNGKKRGGNPRNRTSGRVTPPKPGSKSKGKSRQPTNAPA